MTTKSIYKSILCISFFLLTVSSTCLSNPVNNLFSFDPQVKSSQDAMIPITQSLQEWDITFDASLVNSNNESFYLSLPNTTQVLSVVRTSFSKYASGNTQWVGEIISSEGSVGYIIVNMINNYPYAVININTTNYEIYSDSQVGTRLANVITNTNQNDMIDASIETIQPPSLINNVNGTPNNVNGTSIVDVLILIDNDLNFTNSPIYNKIAVEQMNANYILSTSSINNGSIPLRLNFLPIDIIDVAPSLYSVNPTEYLEIANGQSNGSIALRNKYNISNADFVALYIPFHPQTTSDGACGLAARPLNIVQAGTFISSFSLLADSCTNSSFTLLHEIMHNFGSSHNTSENAFQPYARGINSINSFGDGVSTVLDCSGFLLGGNPSTTSCGRLPQLSTPLVTIDGAIMGNALTADNVRFLSECNAQACRRDQLANRVVGSNPVDLIPSVTILTPSDGAVIEVTNSYTLTANASDDNGIVSVQWDIDGPGGIMDSGTGLGVNYAFTTSVFTTPGQYIISARAEDTIGQIKIDTNVITVISLPEFQSNVSQGQQIDFSFVNDGASASRSIEISNLGQGDLQVTGCSVNNSNFTVTGCPFNIPGSSATTQDITVQCTPSTVTETTTLVGTLTINTNDSDEAVVNYPMNCTALSADALFADSGEPTTFNGACSLSKWSLNIGFTAATQVTTPRYNGICGFQQSHAAALNDQTPLNESRFRARFYFYAEPSGTTSGTGVTTLLTAFQSNSVFNQVFDIKFDGTSVIINSTGVGVDAIAPISNTGWHSIEFDWNQNGQISLWVDSDAKTQPASASGTFNTMNRVIGAINLGEPGQLDSNYSRIIFDDYESHRTTPIGRHIKGDTNSDNIINVSDLTRVIDEVLLNVFSIGSPDCNEDGFINVGDITCIVDIIFGN